MCSVDTCASGGPCADVSPRQAGGKQKPIINLGMKEEKIYFWGLRLPSYLCLHRELYHLLLVQRIDDAHGEAIDRGCRFWIGMGEGGSG